MAYPFKLKLPGLDTEISLSEIKSLGKKISSKREIKSISDLLEFIISDTILSSKENRISEDSVNLDFLRKATNPNTPEGKLFELVKPVLSLGKKETDPQKIIDFFESGIDHDPTGKFHTSGKSLSKMIYSDIFKNVKGKKLVKPESILRKQPFWEYFNNVKNLDFFQENPDAEPQDLKNLSTSKAKAYFTRILRSMEGENISPEDTRDIIRDVLNGYSKQDRENDTVFELTIPDLKLLNGNTEDVSMFLNLENLPIDDLTAFNTVNDDGTLKNPKRFINFLNNNKEIMYRFISSRDTSSKMVLRILPLFIKAAEQQNKLDNITTTIVNPDEYPEPNSASDSVIRLNSQEGVNTPFTLGGEGKESLKYISDLVNSGGDGPKGYSTDGSDRIRLRKELFNNSDKGGAADFRGKLFREKGEDFDNLYLDDDMARVLELGLNGEELSEEDLKIIQSGLIIDPSTQKVRVRDVQKYKNTDGYSFIYEHAIPVNVIEKIFNFIDNQEDDETLKNKVKKKVLEKLHKVGWLTVNKDNVLDALYKETIPEELKKLIGLDFIKGNPEALKINDEDTLEDIYDNINNLTDDDSWLRYTKRNINPMVKLSDVFGGSKEIKVPGIKRSDIELGQDTLAEEIKESKKPLLTNLLFGYYG